MDADISFASAALDAAPDTSVVKSDHEGWSSDGDEFFDTMELPPESVKVGSAPPPPPGSIVIARSSSGGSTTSTGVLRSVGSPRVGDRHAHPLAHPDADGVKEPLPGLLSNATGRQLFKPFTQVRLCTRVCVSARVGVRGLRRDRM